MRVNPAGAATHPTSAARSGHMHCGFVASRLWGTPCLQHASLLRPVQRQIALSQRCFAATMPEGGLKIRQQAQDLPHAEDVLQRLRAAIGLRFPEGSEVCCSSMPQPWPLPRFWSMLPCMHQRTAIMHCVQVCFSGHGKHLGLAVSWQVKCRADGAFVEEIVGQHLSFTYGHPGVSSSGLLRQGWGVCAPVLQFLGSHALTYHAGPLQWTMDNIISLLAQIEWDGLPKQLQLDDHEACLRMIFKPACDCVYLSKVP